MCHKASPTGGTAATAAAVKARARTMSLFGGQRYGESGVNTVNMNN